MLWGRRRGAASGLVSGSLPPPWAGQLLLLLLRVGGEKGALLFSGECREGGISPPLGHSTHCDERA